MTNPWRCPNTPPCPHPGLLHDIEDYDDPSPTCCAEGCTCGRKAEHLNINVAAEADRIMRRHAGVPPREWRPIGEEEQ